MSDSPDSAPAPKEALRARLKAQLKAQSQAERLQRSARAADTLAQLLEQEVPAGSLLAVFSATPEEITLASVLPRLQARYSLCWPRVDGGTLTFRACPEEALVPGFRPWLPEPPPEAPVVQPAALVVPGRAFTRQGGRLGRGAGFYDRALSALPQGLKIGYCFEFQRLQELPLEPHDEPVDWLVTDQGPATRCTTRA